jgi:predicted nucleic-acid-binding protein
VKAIDTCVLARAIVGDDPVQTALADRRLADGAFVPLTVVLELVWLLRSRYAYSRAQVADTLADLCEHPGLVISEEGRMPWLITRLRAGADMPDLVHLIASFGCESFVTFDDMVREVGPDTPVPVELLVH